MVGNHNSSITELRKLLKPMPQKCNCGNISPSDFVFTHNTEIPNMRVTDRALFILQHFGIKMTEIEYLGLK